MNNSVEYHKHFGISAPALGWIPAPRYSLRRARVLDLVGNSAGRFLDIGCGPGRFLVDLARRGWQAEGLESSAKARQVGKEMLADTDVFLHSEPNKDWKGAFDYICALEVLEPIEDDVAALRTWADWLKPGGKAILSVPAHAWMWNARDIFSGHFRRCRREQLIEVVENAGLTVEHSEYYGFPLATLIEFFRYGAPATFIRKIQRTLNSSGKLHTANTGDDRTMGERTADSGTDRSKLVKYWPICNSRPTATALRAMIALQSVPMLRYLGNGLIIIASRR